jgi:hypothetical protein
MIYCIYHKRYEHLRDFRRHHTQQTLPDGALKERVNRELQLRGMKEL